MASEAFSANGIYGRIWNLARPYLNTRKNDIHTKIASELAQQLLIREGGEEEIVMPAIILHDVGWKSVPEDVQLKAFGPKNSMPEWNRVHEVEGERIAGEILQEVNYPEEKISEIQDIIKGHDSRAEAVSLNDAIVKDADKLWRYSETSILHIQMGFGLTFKQCVARLRRKLDQWFLTESGKQMARLALKRLQKLNPDDVAPDSQLNG